MAPFYNKASSEISTSFYTWRCCKIVKVDNINLCKKRERRSNADKLWDVVKDLWPINSQWQTIYEIKELAPIGTAGIDNRSSYDFAMLTMLSTVRRNFVIHELISTEKK